MKVTDEWLKNIYNKIMAECEDIKDKNERISCKLDVLYRITELQDWININTFRDLDDMDDPRWIPLHMIDNANAIILGIARNKAYPDRIIKEGYVNEKINSLEGKWFEINYRYKE